MLKIQECDMCGVQIFGDIFECEECDNVVCDDCININLDTCIDCVNKEECI